MALASLPGVETSITTFYPWNVCELSEENEKLNFKEQILLMTSIKTLR